MTRPLPCHYHTMTQPLPISYWNSTIPVRYRHSTIIVLILLPYHTSTISSPCPWRTLTICGAAFSSCVLASHFYRHGFSVAHCVHGCVPFCQSLRNSSKLVAGCTGTIVRPPRDWTALLAKPTTRARPLGIWYRAWPPARFPLEVTAHVSAAFVELDGEVPAGTASETTTTGGGAGGSEVRSSSPAPLVSLSDVVDDELDEEPTTRSLIHRSFLLTRCSFLWYFLRFARRCPIVLAVTSSIAAREEGVAEANWRRNAGTAGNPGEPGPGQATAADVITRLPLSQTGCG